MNIAFMGIRGIPASYSGFETFVEQLAKRLVRRGHNVTVYNRRRFVPYGGKTYLGINLVRLPSFSTKHLDSIVHTFFCCIHALFRSYDVVYICGVGNSPLALLLRWKKTKVVVNVDGADWKRDKWNALARAYLRWCEPVAARLADAVIADSRVIQDRYRETQNTHTLFIPYGANLCNYDGSDMLKRFGLEARGYVLFVGRLVPENCAHTLVSAFSMVETDLKLVIVGDAPYSDDYKRSLMRDCGRRVMFTGYLFGEEYQEISCNAYLYVMASGVDGTRPVLLDQMAFGNAVLTRNSPANLEVVGDAAAVFDDENDVFDLAVQLQYLVDHPEETVTLRVAAEERVKTRYSWERVADRYELLIEDLSENRDIATIADHLETELPLEPVKPEPIRRSEATDNVGAVILE
jgi:glycosyltransferase involved in cell wall biosynthesis